ncbi:MAG: hypothetical protein Q9M91_00440 [Candidatus Dojkabacteria bacterium]|nr:hypothetical protein [Candidatus Dojkabacteria bacterium]
MFLTKEEKKNIAKGNDVSMERVTSESDRKIKIGDKTKASKKKKIDRLSFQNSQKEEKKSVNQRSKKTPKKTLKTKNKRNFKKIFTILGLVLVVVGIFSYINIISPFIKDKSISK